MAMPSGEGASFEVVQAEAVLELAVVVLNRQANSIPQTT
jgi:hypothetical protein